MYNNDRTIGKILNITTKMFRQKVKEEALSEGINMTEIWILSTLSKNIDKELTQKDICDILKLTAPSISITLTNLENEGLIERKKSTIDSRKTIISITEKGNNKSELCKKYFIKIDELLENSVSSEELEIFYKCMNSFIIAMEEYNV